MRLGSGWRGRSVLAACRRGSGVLRAAGRARGLAGGEPRREEVPLRGDPEGARHSRLQLREDRRRARRRRNSATSRSSGTRPETADQLKQKEILESFITQRVDGIAISSLNGDFLTETINRAIDAGIPVVTWDSDAPKSKRIAFYGVDDRGRGPHHGRAGDQAAGRQGQGRDHHQPGRHQPAEPARRREGGAGEAARASRSSRSTTSRKTPSAARRSSRPARAAIPISAAWISVGGWPVFTRNALAAVDPAKTKVISFDTIPPALDLLREGKVQVLLGQKYFGWGSESVQAPPRHQAGQAAGVADHRLGRGRRHEGQRRAVRGELEEAGGRAAMKGRKRIFADRSLPP